MNKIIVLRGVLLAFTLQYIASMSIYAGEVDGIKSPRRIPSPPPTPAAPCPPMPPGVDIEQTCKTRTLYELQTKYLDSEGENNRGLNFYYYSAAFFNKHRIYTTTTVNQANFSFNTQTMFEELGQPDYKKKLTKDNVYMDVYAYVFTNKSNRDYVMVVYTANELVYRYGYSETDLIIDESWKKAN